MSCTKRFLGFQWERHSWRRRVTSFETLTLLEPDMWARDVYRDYVRCDKEDVCEVCGKVRRRASCVCDTERAEVCQLRGACIAETQSASHA
jgi:hypothetical protein